MMDILMTGSVVEAAMASVALWVGLEGAALGGERHGSGDGVRWGGTNRGYSMPRDRRKCSSMELSKDSEKKTENFKNKLHIKSNININEDLLQYHIMRYVQKCISYYKTTYYSTSQLTWHPKILTLHILYLILIDDPDSRLGPSQWETSLHSNAVSHWLGANLESALL